ncbi:hypothetical protein Tco_1113551, partial [Tanacetum coccineum]
VNLDNSTNNVLIPLDSWTSRLLEYRLPLSGNKDALCGCFNCDRINVSRSYDEVPPKFKNDMPLRDK